MLNKIDRVKKMRLHEFLNHITLCCSIRKWMYRLLCSYYETHFSISECELKYSWHYILCNLSLGCKAKKYLYWMKSFVKEKWTLRVRSIENSGFHLIILATKRSFLSWITTNVRNCDFVYQKVIATAL